MDTIILKGGENMAGNISNLNVQNLEAKIKEYYGTVSKLNIYDYTLAIKRLPQYWTGKAVNDIIEEYNRISTSLYEGCVYFEETVLGTLGQIYEQYLSMENGKPLNINQKRVSSVPQMSSAKGIKQKISITSTTDVKFDEANVDKEVKKIYNAIDSTNATLRTLTTKLDDLEPYSDSLRKLVVSYRAKSRTLTAEIISLQSNLQEIIHKSVSAVKVTEKAYNESDVKKML